MVLIQDLPGYLNVHPLPGPLVPGQLQHSVQIIPEHRPLRRTKGLLGHAIDVLQKLLLHLLVQMECLDFGAVSHRFLLLVLLPQLGSDHLHLLPEVIVPLTPVNLLPGLVLHLRLQLQNLQLMAQQPQGHVQTPHRVQLGQELGLLLVAEGGVLADGVCQKARLMKRQNPQLQLLGRLLDQIQKLVEDHHRLPHQGFRLGCAGVTALLWNGLHPACQAGL